MSWTTLPGQKTTTSPKGRDPLNQGMPLDPLRMAAAEESTAFAARASLDSPGNIRLAKQYIQKAFRYQIQEGRYSIVEFLSPCPTDWNMTPTEAIRWIRDEVVRYYPLGIFKDITNNKQ